MLPNRCIILASGASVKQGIELGLWNYLETEVTFGINEAIKFCDCTAYTFGDWCAYADRFDLYKNRALVIGRHDFHIGRKIEGARECPKHDSLVLLKGSGKYHGAEGLEKGLYSSTLTGAFTLNLAIRLGFKQIFLLGFDNCEVNNKTHWYQDIEGAGQYTDYEGKAYTGMGKNERGEYNTSFYNNNDASINALWTPFVEESNNVMIYNVSLESRINTFTKIGYYSFFKILKESPLEINQDEVRKEIRTILQPYNKE